MISVTDFAAKIKAKYPQYQNVDDTTLTQKIVEKYPVYKGQVDLSTGGDKQVGLASSIGGALAQKFGGQAPDTTAPAPKMMVGSSDAGQQLVNKQTASTVQNFNRSGFDLSGSQINKISNASPDEAEQINQGLDEVQGQQLGAFGNLAYRTGQNAVAGVKQIGGGIQKMGQGVMEGNGTKSFSGFQDVLEGGLGTAFSPISGATETLPHPIQNIVKPILNIPNMPAEGVAYVAGALAKYFRPDLTDQQIQENVVRPVRLAGQIGTIVAAPEIAEKSGELLNKGANAVSDFGNAVKGKTAPAGAKIITSVDKIDPTKVVDFQRMTSKAPGEWLQERGIVAPRAETVSKLVDYYNQSKATVDNALKQIDGRFYDSNAETILKDQIKYFEETADKTRLSTAQKQLQRLQDSGLTLDEMNQVKRTYEATQKMGYLKENNSTGVARATNLDSGLRKFMVDTAADRGFKNLPEINKETQAAKFLADQIYKKMNKQAANDVLGLTDKLLGYGGLATMSPTTLAVLGLKKIAFGETGKSFLARLLSPEATKGIPNVDTGAITLSNARRMLPAPKEGTPAAQVNTPIDLPSRSQGAIDTAEQARIQGQQFAKKATSIPNQPLLPEGKAIQLEGTIPYEGDRPVQSRSIRPSSDNTNQTTPITARKPITNATSNSDKTGTNIKPSTGGKSSVANLSDEQLNKIVGDINAGGVTYDVKTNKSLGGTKKFAVSPYPERSFIKNGDINLNDIADFIENNRDLLVEKGHTLGGWFDTEARQLYLDVAVVTKNVQKALQLAKRFNQKAIFDLHNFKEIKTGGTGEAIGGKIDTAKKLQQILKYLQ